MAELEDQNEPAALNEPDPDDVAAALMRAVRLATINAGDDPFTFGELLERRLPGGRRRLLRVLAFECGVRIATEEALFTLQKRAERAGLAQLPPAHHRIEALLQHALSEFDIAELDALRQALADPASLPVRRWPTAQQDALADPSSLPVRRWPTAQLHPEPAVDGPEPAVDDPEPVDDPDDPAGTPADGPR